MLSDADLEDVIAELVAAARAAAGNGQELTEALLRAALAQVVAPPFAARPPGAMSPPAAGADTTGAAVTSAPAEVDQGELGLDQPSAGSADVTHRCNRDWCSEGW
jgi:hypothetical protein